jgi:hypothetical protein
MPQKYVPKSGAPSRQQWALENLREAMKRLEQGHINVREASRYYGIPMRFLNRIWESGDLEKELDPPCKHVSPPVIGLRETFTLISKS